MKRLRSDQNASTDTQKRLESAQSPMHLPVVERHRPTPTTEITVEPRQPHVPEASGHRRKPNSRHYEPEGRPFESVWAHHIKLINSRWLATTSFGGYLFPPESMPKQ